MPAWATGAWAVNAWAPNSWAGMSQPPVLLTSALANGQVGTPYSFEIPRTGDEPLTWTIESGALPDGLALDEDTGVVSGTPTTAESQTPVIRATNSAGFDEDTLEITIVDPSAGGGGLYKNLGLGFGF